MATRDYRIRLPRDTSVRAACEEVGCESWQFGWETVVDERTVLGNQQAAYIRHRSGRTFTEMRGSEPGVIVFRFGSGQRCFAEHRTRPARFLAGQRQVATLGDWIGDLEDHVGHLEDRLRKG